VEAQLAGAFDDDRVIGESAGHRAIEAVRRSGDVSVAAEPRGSPLARSWDPLSKRESVMDAQTEDPTAPGTRAGTGGAGGGRLHEHTDDEAPTEAFRQAGARFGELAEYVSYFIAAKTDGLKLTLRNVAVFAALGVVGLIAAGAMVVSGVVLLCWGIALALSALFGHHLWAGYLVTGVLLLGMIGGGTMIGLKKLTGTSRERMVKKYATRQTQQRGKFGRDVQQAASDPAE